MASDILSGGCLMVWVGLVFSKVAVLQAIVSRDRELCEAALIAGSRATLTTKPPPFIIIADTDPTSISRVQQIQQKYRQPFRTQPRPRTPSTLTRGARVHVNPVGFGYVLILILCPCWLDRQLNMNLLCFIFMVKATAGQAKTAPPHQQQSSNLEPKQAMKSCLSWGLGRRSAGRCSLAQTTTEPLMMMMMMMMDDAHADNDNDNNEAPHPEAPRSVPT